MRGRKKGLVSIRDGRDPATELTKQIVVEAQTDLLGKPIEIKNNPRLNGLWDSMIGDGRAFQPQDIPILANWMQWVDLAIQLRMRMTKEDGTLETTVMRKRGEEYVEVDSPLFKQYIKATEMSTRLSEQLGGTPIARARLGLTRAATASIGDDIRSKVIQALEQRALEGN